MKFILTGSISEICPVYKYLVSCILFLTLYKKPYLLKTKNIEEELILKLRSGNMLAFNLLFEEYSSKLYIFANGYLKSKEDAEGLVQDVFTTIWEKRGQLKPELSFKSFLFTIAYNNIKNHFRQKSQFRRFANNELFEKITTETVQEIDYNSLRDHVLDIVKSLPEKRRLVFLKSRIEGLTNKEIAEELGLTKKTIENHLNLALKQVKNRIEGGNASLMLFYCMFVN